MEYLIRVACGYSDKKRPVGENANLGHSENRSKCQPDHFEESDLTAGGVTVSPLVAERVAEDERGVR
jgi:hypothetical protein